jgi:hypothetical protein
MEHDCSRATASRATPAGGVQLYGGTGRLAIVTRDHQSIAIAHYKNPKSQCGRLKLHPLESRPW